jgi:hypothetical protein
MVETNHSMVGGSNAALIGTDITSIFIICISAAACGARGLPVISAQRVVYESIFIEIA